MAARSRHDQSSAFDCDAQPAGEHAWLVVAEDEGVVGWRPPVEPVAPTFEDLTEGASADRCRRTSARRDDAPAGDRTGEHESISQPRAVHQPHRDAAVHVLPDEIAAAVGVDVRGGAQLPARAGRR